MRLEVPPWQIAGGWHTYFFSNGSETNTYSDPHDMINSSSANIEGHGPYFAIGPDLSKPWKQGYSEIYSAHDLQHPSMGLINLGFCHGENKNLCDPPRQNTINPTRPVICPDGGNDWDAYYAIPHAAWTLSNASNNWGQQGYQNEIGPFVWPSNGYVCTNDQTASQGLSHPSSIVAGDYIYIFLNDTGPRDCVPLEEGRGRGIKLVRVHKNNCLNPSAYEVYYKDPSGSVHWLPSLPSGFTKETMQNYVKVQGPKSTNILPDLLSDNSNCLRFSVAQVNGQNYFIGCEEYLADNEPGSDGAGNHHVALRFSYDLMNWSPRIKVIESAENYGASNLNYPIFLSANGWTNTAIDLNNFYVIGVHSTSDHGFPNWVTRVHIYENVSPPVACDWYMYIGSVPSPSYDYSGATCGDIDITGDKLTIEALFNSESYDNATDGGTLVSKHCNSTDANYFLRPKSGGITTTNGSFQVNLPCDLEMNTTYHVAMVYDGAQLSIYRNGIWQASVPATGNLVTNDWQTTIGTEACSTPWSNSGNFRGYIGELRIWKKVRTEQELRQFYNVTYPYNDPDLLGYYSFYNTMNRGSFHGGANTFGNANVNQTNTSCNIDNVGCFGFARTVNVTTASSPASNIVIYPNPAIKSATMIYSSNVAGMITINVIDVTGKRAMVMKKPVMKGSNTVNMDLNSLSNGVYSIQIIDGNKMQTKKLVISK
jgi:hypothetical protein